MMLVECANCGKQTMVDEPEDNCQFCGKNATKKEAIIAEKAVEERVVPPKPKKRNKLWQYYEKNKEAIVTDYHSMTLREFFKRWRLSTSTWMKLKKMWGVSTKVKAAGTSPQPAKPPRAKEYKEPKPKPGEFCILITEADLAKLDDDDYRLLWVLLGKIIKNRLS